MAKQKAQVKREMSGVERLALRVSAMINAPRSQLERRVTIHRLDTDSDQAWEAVLEQLAEVDELALTFNDDGSVALDWALSTQEGNWDAGEMPAADEDSASIPS